MFGRHGHDRPAPGDPIGGWCEHCGTAYVPGATECPECRAPVAYVAPTAPIVDPAPVQPALVEPVLVEEAGERHDIVEYDLAGWTEHQFVELTRQLDVEHIAHEWHHGVLHVPGSFEAHVDELVDTFDGALPEDAGLVDYEVPDWTMEQCDELVRRMQELDTPYEWNGVTLTVPSSLEATVDTIVRAIDPAFPT